MKPAWTWSLLLEEYRRGAPGVVALVRYLGPGRRWGWSVTTATGTTSGEGWESADLAQTAADAAMEREVRR